MIAVSIFLLTFLKATMLQTIKLIVNFVSITLRERNVSMLCLVWSHYKMVLEFVLKNIVKRVMAVLRSYINWSCISTWIQTSTVWTDKQIDGRHIDITQMHGIQIHRQTLHSLCGWWIQQLVLLNLFVWCSFVQRIF